MDEIILFKNNLSFLKSVITLIVTLFLGIANDREFHSESFFEDFYWKYPLRSSQLVIRISIRDNED
jgi:hypothetical protein